MGKRKGEGDGGSSKKKQATSNNYLSEVMELKQSIPCWDALFQASDEDREQAMMRLEVLGAPLQRKYAWAVPDERALKIITYFSPIVELGCGQAYWCKLLRDRGCDVIAVDKYTKENNDKPFIDDIVAGDASFLKNKKKCKGRALMLCYPDDRESLSLDCLEVFQGDTIIHVGELCTTLTGTHAAGLQRPWGRTTCSEFQVELATAFHCVLNQKLAGAFPHSNDYISVWKRTQFVTTTSSSSDDEEEEEEEEGWAVIPAGERLPVINVAAPAFQHLLE